MLRDKSNNEIILGPPYTYSVGLAYRHDLGNGSGLDINLGWAYRGRECNDADLLRTTRQDAYGLLDSRITWWLANGRSSVSLVGTNLLDEEFLVGGTGQPDRDGQLADVLNGFYWGSPRRMRLELRHGF